MSRWSAACCSLPEPCSNFAMRACRKGKLRRNPRTQGARFSSNSPSHPASATRHRGLILLRPIPLQCQRRRLRPRRCRRARSRRIHSRRLSRRRSEKSSGRRGSNSRPQAWEACALPTELHPHARADYLSSGRPAASRALANTSSSIGSVRRPVKVFCWLTW